MKRSADEENDTVKKMKESDLNVLHELQDKFSSRETDSSLDDELEKAKHKYYVSYFKKVVERLPLSHNVIDVTEIPESHDGFLKIYSIAKTFVNAEIELKKLKTFHSIADVIGGSLGKFVHAKIVSPYLTKFVPDTSLDRALEVYQNHLTCEDDHLGNDLHCISYLIQNEIEKKEPLRIPDPKCNIFTHQLTALSKYIIEILKCAVQRNNQDIHLENV